jgi:hypothetical protein
MRKRVGILILLLAITCGCSLKDWAILQIDFLLDGYGPDFCRHEDGNWIGCEDTDLIATRGEPSLILEARPRKAQYRDGIPAMSYVYFPTGDQARSCIDTYVVVEETRQVVRYYCR